MQYTKVFIGGVLYAVYFLLMKSILSIAGHIFMTFLNHNYVKAEPSHNQDVEFLVIGV